MLEHTDDIVSGIKLIMKYLDLKKCYIGIENNKPDAIAKMRDAVKDIPGAEVTELRSTYPQGAERVLIHETAGKTLNAGELPTFKCNYYTQDRRILQNRYAYDQQNCNCCGRCHHKA